MRPKPEQFRRSTTRAIAWGAMFFSFLSFLISLATLLLTWHDGRLARNFGESAQLIAQSVGQFRRTAADRSRSAETARDTATTPTTTSADDSAPDDSARAIWQRLDGKFQRMQELIRGGDARAKLYVNLIRTDLEDLRTTSTTQRAVWLLQAMQTLKTVDDQLSRNAPEAARRIQGLANELRRRLTEPGQLRPVKEAARPAPSEPAAEAEPTAEKASPEPAASGKTMANKKAAPQAANPERLKLAEGNQP